MGENNTISLLSSINGYLKMMVEESKTNGAPGSPQQAQASSQKMVSDLHKGGLNSSATAGPSPKNAPGKMGDIVISAKMLASLTTLASSVKEISKLKGKEVEAFKKVIKSIGESLKAFTGEDYTKSAKVLVKTVEALSSLQKVGLTKLAISMKGANTVGFSKALGKIVDGVVNAAKKARKLKNNDAKNLKTIGESVKALTSLATGTAILMLTVVGLAVAIKKLGAKDIMLSLGLTMLTITALSGLAILISKFAGSSKRSTQDLKSVTSFIFMMQVLVITTLLLGKLVKSSIKDILVGFAATSAIILGYSAIVALASVLAKFVSMQKSAMMTIVMVAGWGMALTLGTLAMGFLAQMAWPQILIGFAVVSGIILGYTLVVALASVLAKFITMEKSTMLLVMAMAAWGTALTLGTLLMGYVAQLAWPEILLGFVAVSGIILGYIAIAALASMIMELIPSFKQDILAVAIMAGLGMGLVLGTLLMGCVAKLAWPEILIGFGTITLLLEGFAGLAKLVSITAKGVGKSIKNFYAVAMLAAAAEGLLAAAVAIAWVTKKAGVSVGEILLVLGGVFAVVAELTGFAFLAGEIPSKGVTAGINKLKSLVLVAYACEGIILGAIVLAKLMESTDPVALTLSISLTAGIVAGLILIAKKASLGSKSIATGAKSLLLLAGVALAAEAILGGAILLAKMLDDDTYMYGKIGGVLGVCTLIIEGLILLVKQVENRKKDITNGAKSLLLVEAIALGAEAILGGAILLAKMLDNDPWMVIKIPAVLGVCTVIIKGLINLVEQVENRKKDIAKGAKSLLLVEAIALGAEAILGGAILLSKMLDEPGRTKSTLYVIGFVWVIIRGLVKLVKQVENHNKDLMKGVKSLALVEAVAAGAGLLLIGAMGIVKLKEEMAVSWEDIIYVVTAMTTIVGLFGGLAALAGKIDKQMKKGIKSMGMILLFAGAAELLLGGIIGLMILKNTNKVEWSDVFISIGAMVTIVTAFGLLAAAVGAVTTPVTAALPGVGVITLFAGAAELLLAGVICLMALKNELKVDWDDVFITIDAMVIVVSAFGALAFAVGAATVPITAALPGVGVITLFAAGAELLLGGVIGLMALKNDLKVDWEDVFTAIGAMATIVGAFGVLALAVGAATVPITAALPGVGVITLFAAGAELLLGGLIALMAVKNELKAEWDDIFTAVDAMATVVGYFGLLGTAIGIATPLITVGALGMAAVIAFAASAEGLLGGLITLMGKKNELKVEWDDIDIAIDRTGQIVEEFSALAGIASFAMPFLLAGSVGLDVAIDTAGRTVKVLDSVVNVAAKAKSIGSNAWDDIERTVQMMGRIITNSSNKPGFKELCEKASWAYPFLVAGSNGLDKVSDTAKLASKSLIEVCKAAAVAKDYTKSDITKVIYDMNAITEALYDVVGIKFIVEAEAISNAKPHIDRVSDAAMHIAQMLSDLAGCSKNGLIRGVYKLKDGRIKYGEWVDAQSSANTIANTFCGFVDTLHNTFKDIDAKSIENMEKGMKAIGNVMGPVSTFAETMSSFLDAGEGKIRIIKYDDKGKLIDTPAIDLAHVAGVIGRSVSIFCQNLFTEKNQSLWERMVSGGGDGVGEASIGQDGVNVKSEYKPGAAERAMGIFATVIDPICNFASTLAMFEDTSDDSTLVIPVYDKDGNIIERRTVNVVNVANKLSNAVTSFMSALATKSRDWQAIYNSQQYTVTTGHKHSSGFLGIGSSDEYTHETRNKMGEAFGVFGTVIAPVVSFANMLKIFGDTGQDGELLVYDNEGKARTIKPKIIANTIADVITSFISTLSSGISANSSMFSTISDQKDTIVALLEGLTNSMVPLGQLEYNDTEKFYEAYKVLMDYVISLDNESSKTAIQNVSTNLETLKSTILEFGNGWGALIDKFKASNTVDFIKCMECINNSLIDVDTSSQTVKTSVENIKILVDYICSLTGETANNFNSVNTMFCSLKTSISTLLNDLSKLLSSNVVKDNSLATMFSEIHKTALESATSIDTFSTIAIAGFNELDKIPTTLSNLVTSITSSTPSINNALSTVRMQIHTAVNDKKTGIKTTLDSADLSINNVKTSLNKLDSALNNGNKTRIKNIKAIKDEITALNAATASAKGNIDAVARSFTAMANFINLSASGNIANAVQQLNSLNPIRVESGVGGYAGGYAGGGASADDIKSAIKEALSNMTVRLKVFDKNSTSTTRIIGDYEVNDSNVSFSSFTSSDGNLKDEW